VTTEQAASTETVFNHHLQSVMAHDLAAIMSDYTDDSVMLTPQGPLRGLAALEATFRDFVLPLISEEFVQNMKVLRQDIVNDVVYLLWEVPGIAHLGLDVFVIREGKIVSQSFAMHPQT
jgi:ketosteroid isomerase-like protein